LEEILRRGPMQRINTFLLAACISLLIVVGSLIHALNQHALYIPQSNVEQKSNTALKGEYSAKSAASESISANEKDGRKDEQTDEKESEFWTLFGLKLKITDSFIAFFNLGLFVFTGFLWNSTEKLFKAGERQLQLLRRTSLIQSRDMQASITAANRSAAAAERALTDLERPWIFVFGVTRPLRDIDDEFFVSYTVANYGKMPAIVEYPRLGFVFEDAHGQPQSPILVSEDHSLMTSQILKAGEEREFRAYFPASKDGSVRFQILHEGTQREALHPIPSVESDHIMFFRAIISYRGPVSRGHETGANWLYREPWDFVTRLDKYNYTN
jgi:hypothetical protein